MKSGEKKLKNEDDTMYDSDETVITNSQEMKHKKKKNHKIEAALNSQAEESESLLTIKKRKYSGMLGASISECDEGPINKKKKKNGDLNINGSDDCSILGPIKNIKQENDTTDVFSSDYSIKQHKKKKDKGVGSNISQNKVGFFSQDIFKPLSSEEFVNSTPKMLKKKKNKEMDSSSLRENGNISYQEDSFNSSFLSTSSSKKASELHHSFDIDNDDSKSFDTINESEIIMPCRKHKRKIITKVIVTVETDSSRDNGLNPKNGESFFCSFCQSSVPNISKDGKKDVIDSRVGNMTNNGRSCSETFKESTGIIKDKKKPKKRIREPAVAIGKKYNALLLLDKYLEKEDTLSDDEPIIINATTNVNNDFETVKEITNTAKKKKRKSSLNESNNVNGTINISDNVLTESLDNYGQDILDGSSATTNVKNDFETVKENTNRAKKKKRKSSLNESLDSYGQDILDGSSATTNVKNDFETVKENTNRAKKKKRKSSLNESLDSYVQDFLDGSSATTNVKNDFETVKENTNRAKKKKRKSSLNESLDSYVQDFLDGSSATTNVKNDFETVKENTNRAKKKKRKSSLNESLDSYGQDILDGSSATTNVKNDFETVKEDTNTAKKKKRKSSLNENNKVNGTTNISDKVSTKLLDNYGQEILDGSSATTNVNNDFETVKENTNTAKKKKRKSSLNESNEANGTINISDNVSTESLDSYGQEILDGSSATTNVKIDFETMKENTNTAKKKKRKSSLNESNKVNGTINISDNVSTESLDNYGQDILDGSSATTKVKNDFETVKENTNTAKKKKRKSSLNESLENYGRDILDGSSATRNVKNDFETVKKNTNTAKKKKRKSSLNESNKVNGTINISDNESTESLDNYGQDILDGSSSFSAEKTETSKHNKSSDTSKNSCDSSNGIEVDLISSDDSDDGVEIDRLEILKSRLKGLTIEVDFPVPELHQVCDRASKPTPQQKIKLALEKISFRSGKFVKAEDMQIKENWRQFIERYNFEDVPEVFYSLDKKYISVKEKRNFLYWLARGLDERTPFSVYQRFKVLMLDLKRGRFTAEEDKYIQDTMEETGCSRNYITDIALHLQRPFHSVVKRIGRLKEQHTRKIRWRENNMAAFIKYLLKVTGTEPDELETLKDRHISSQEWRRLSKKLDNVPLRILKQAWLEKIHPRLFIPDVCCDLRKVKLKLIDMFYENDEHDWRAVNWASYASHFEGLTTLRLYTLMKNLVHCKVSKKKRNNLKKCINILRKCSKQDLLPHVIYKMKYENGKILELEAKEKKSSKNSN